MVVFSTICGKTLSITALDLEIHNNNNSKILINNNNSKTTKATTITTRIPTIQDANGVKIERRLSVGKALEDFFEYLFFRFFLSVIWMEICKLMLAL